MSAPVITVCGLSVSVGVNRATAKWLYPSLLLLSVVFCNTVPGGALILALTTVALIASASWHLLCPSCCARSSSDQRLAATGGAAREEEGDGAALIVRGDAVDRVAAAAPREHYLDNLKAALTVIVVVHHALGAFAGVGSLGLSVGNFRTVLQVPLGVCQILNQCYFMSFFFFISALLTPASLSRKGPRAFLAEKLKRLGLPFLFYFFILGPLLTNVNDVIATGRGPSYTPNAGPAWFLCWLIIFNVAYVLVEVGSTSGAFIECARPSLAVMLGLGTIAGLLQAFHILLAPSYFFMPITFSSLPVDGLFFAAGIVASRNGWLSTPFSRSVILMSRGVVVAFTVALVVSFSLIYANGGGWAIFSRNFCGEAPDRGDIHLGVVAFIAALAVAGGAYAVAASIAALDLFRSHANATGPWRSYLSRNSYAVYLLHASLVLPLTAVFIVVTRLRLGKGAMRTWSDGSGGPLYDSPDCVRLAGDATSSSAILFAGFICVATLSVLSVYPLASIVRKLPGLRSIL